jgi:hypothetical protein
MLRLTTLGSGRIVAPSVAIAVREGAMAITRREALAAVAGVLAMTGAAQDKQSDKPPHVVEKPDKKAGVDTFAHGPTKVVGDPNEDLLLSESKLFMSRMPSGHGDLRFRDFFDPRYLKKHRLTDRDIAFEVTADWPWYRGIHNIVVADDNQTALCILDTKEGKELFILRWVVYEGHLYISPEKAPDPKTGIFKPWILRTKVK